MRSRSQSRSRHQSRSRIESLENWGLPDQLTADQTEKLQELKIRVPDSFLEHIKFDVESPDSAYCRFLRARKFDVDASLVMIDNCQNRRIEDNVEACVQDGPSSCLSCPVEVFEIFYPNWYIGFDKFHRIVQVQNSGMINSAAIDCLTATENILRYHWCNMEARNDQFRLAKELYGEANISMTVITDLRGMTTSTMTKKVYQFIKAISKLGSDCYPELMGKMFVINAPMYFVGIWKIIRSWIDPRTASKIEISSHSNTEKLLEVIDADVLPQELGGNAMGRLPRASNALFAYLGRASSHSKEIEIKEDEEFFVRFFTNYSGIQYSVSFRPSGNLRAKKKVLKSVVSDISNSGLYSLEENFSNPGNYTIKWKNTSKLHPKAVVYDIFAPSEPSKSFCFS